MYVIYALIDPRDYTVHYIGQTSDVYKRFNDHIQGKGGSLVKTAWIFELRAVNRMVIMETLEEVETHEQALTREAYWIRYFEALKEPISNVSHRGPLKHLREEQLIAAKCAMSHGLTALKTRRVVEVASLRVGSTEDIGMLFFEKRLNPYTILRKKWPHVRGGDAYQKRSAEINDAIRAYAEVAQEAKGSSFIDTQLSDLEMTIGRLFFVEQLNPNTIARNLWPDIKGGDAYQKKSIEVNEAIRKYVEQRRGHNHALDK